MSPATRSLEPTAAGLGLRRALLGPLRDAAPGDFDFLECAPDNWIGVGGPLGNKLAALSARHPLSCHGLSLSLGGPDPLDAGFLRKTRDFLARHHVALYSEHLSYCSADGHLYDLLPIPFTDEAVHHVAGRIRAVQDALGRRIAVENVSYYAAPYQAMGEIEFVAAVLSEADCDLLLDVNNVFVNAKHLFKVAGVYVAPWDINLGATYQIRDGYLFPQRILSPNRSGAAGTVNLILQPFGESRYDTFQMVDARVAKRFAVGPRSIEASLDIFNVGNVNTVLTRNLNQAASTANQVTGIVAPRVLRLGVRVQF